ncbi:MAG: hypothetical protein FWG69_04220 [Oscillospiraceae bacterium]|nr:hypothetical protein [Oscillospiraceae bacterium]
MNLLLLLSSVGLIGLMIGMAQFLKKLRLKRLSKAEKELTRNNFVITTKIGELNGKVISGGGFIGPSTCSFYMYIDEKNKKFAFASPILKSGVVIHDFNELEAYEIFDLDGVNYDKAVNAMGKVTFGVMGLATGGLLGGALWGLLGTLTGANAAEKLFSCKDGATKSYGFMLKFNNGNSSYVETYDFFASFRMSSKQELTPLKELVANPLKPPRNYTAASSCGRKTEPYKMNTRNIIRMVKFFDKILSSKI